MKFDRIPARTRKSLVPGVAAVCAVALLSGCVSGPTYGTGKSVNVQLLEDLTGIVSTETLMRSQSRGSEIAYTPRPEIVRPASLEVLPEPQQEVVSANNPAWPESPEQRRARIRAEATANRDDVNFRPVVEGPRAAAVTGPRVPLTGPEAALNQGIPQVNTRGSEAHAQAQARANKKQGDPTQRRFLSEPPVEYRAPSANAPVGELGQDEWQKERQAKRGSGKSSWRDFIPGL